MRLRDRLGITVKRQRQATRAMELLLVGLFFVGVERGSTGIIVNTGLAILVTELPGLLERRYDFPLDPGLTLWITAAVFLHALGTVGIPGSEISFYRSVWWWDHVTHALSSSVVAAAGYATTRALDTRSDSIYLPPKFMFAFILLFVLAFGVAWEVLEFGLAELSALLGSGTVLTQYGLSDTMLDLVFDTIGGVIVALWGAAYLTDVVGLINRRYERSGG